MNDRQTQQTGTLLLVYAGRCHIRIEGKKKPTAGYEWYEITDDETEADELDMAGRESKVWSKLKPHGNPGTVYSVTCELDESGNKTTRVYPDSLRYVGRICDDKLTLEWQTRDKAFGVELERERLEKNEGKTSMIDEHLSPVRDVYRKLLPDQKAAFIAYLVNYMNARG